MGRQSNLQQEELDEIRRQFEGERRKSTSIEAAVLNLQKENKRLNDELQDLADDFNDAQHTIESLNDKLRKADEIIDKLGNENNSLKRDLNTSKQSRVE